MEEIGSWQQYASNAKLGYVSQYALANLALHIASRRGWYALALADQIMGVQAIDQVTAPIKGAYVICALADALLDAMVRLLADANLKQTMGREGQRLVQSHYTWNKHGEHFLDLFHRVVKR